MTLDANALIAAINLTSAFWLAVLGVFALIMLTKMAEKTIDIRLMTLGVAIETFGWAGHRGFWGVVRYMQDNGYPQAYDNAEFFWQASAISMAFVMVGIILIVSPAAKMVIGPKWAYVSPLMVLGSLWFTYITITQGI